MLTDFISMVEISLFILRLSVNKRMYYEMLSSEWRDFIEQKKRLEAVVKT